MPTDGFGPVLRMAEAFALVAAVAGPVGLALWRLDWRAAFPTFPAPAADDPAVALGYVVLFVVYPAVLVLLGQAVGAAGLPRLLGVPPDPETAGTWRGVFGSLLAAPLFVAGWVWFAGWRGGAGRAMAVGVGGWLVASPAVYFANAVAEWATVGAGVAPQEHPLVKLVQAGGGGAAALAVSVAAATPFAEEVVFRGLLLGWLLRRPGGAVLPLALTGVIVATAAGPDVRLHAFGFLAVLAVGQLALRRRPAAAAVWATAALFAAVHVGVWPTPLPLFLLGLALGAVAVRTGGVLAGTVLHGLFNAVSLVFLVRG